MNTTGAANTGSSKNTQSYFNTKRATLSMLPMVGV